MGCRIIMKKWKSLFEKKEKLKEDEFTSEAAQIAGRLSDLIETTMHITNDFKKVQFILNFIIKETLNNLKKSKIDDFERISSILFHRKF